MPTWLPAGNPEYAIARTSNTRAVPAGLTFRSLATTTTDTLAWFRALPEATRTQVVRNAGLTEEKERAVLKAWRERQ
jgi:2'-hydroxyisoflavone reductase